MSMNLFAPQAQQGDKSVLVEFKAGMMHKDANTRWVRPDKRKGLVQLKLSADNLIHFIWKERATGVVQTDLIVFPDEAHFRRVKECKTGRVYLLELKSSDKKLFFWLQEPKEDKDEEYCSKINKYMNEPPQPDQSPAAGLEGLDQNALLQMFAGNFGMFTQTQRDRFLSQAGIGGTAANTAAATPSSTPAAAAETEQAAATTTEDQQTQPQPIQAMDLENILKTLGPQVQGQQGPSLGNVFDAEAIIKSGVLNDPEIKESLIALLPEQDRNTPGILELTLRTPQFRQAADMLSAACQQSGPEILKSFGIDTSTMDLGASFGTAAFLKAVIAYVKKEKEGKKEDGEDKMDTS